MHNKMSKKCTNDGKIKQNEENNEHWVSKLTDKQVYIISFILIVSPTLLYYGIKYVLNMLSN